MFYYTYVEQPANYITSHGKLKVYLNCSAARKLAIKYRMQRVVLSMHLPVAPLDPTYNIRVGIITKEELAHFNKTGEFNVRNKTAI